MVAVAEFDYNSNSWTHRAQPAPGAAPQPASAEEAARSEAWEAWRRELAVVAAQMDAEPYQARLEAALELVESGRVDDAPFGAVVRSNGHTYTIDPETGCPCADARNRSRWCKHAVAAELHRRVQARLHKDEGERMKDEQGTPDPVQPSSFSPQPSLPEAPASANAFVVIDGHRVQVTVRGHTLAGVLTELRTVLQQFPAAAAQAPGEPHAAPRQPRREAPEAAPEDDGGPDWCPLHDAPMLWHPANGYGPGWYSHQLEDNTFCKGKLPRRQGRGSGRR
jgi:hypothetical protein